MMNAVLQLIVYPVINNRVGENEFGNMLFLLGILNILAPSFLDRERQMHGWLCRSVKH